ncbi:hypothetical protein SGRA_3287 [Saprospira grandis str. Lewin]|uniref:Uncharacterized protein n=1 Tax=Saprospira grandis (strain Lewin) TaxID=984262 RepID=H6L008_SAPGL|nr:hypothetical protein SGRA_3287 [Saprospira grandis str. Lewin]
MAVGFNLQAQIAGPKGRADLRALQGPGRQRRQAPKKYYPPDRVSGRRPRVFALQY